MTGNEEDRKAGYRKIQKVRGKMEIKCVLGVINELECSQLGYWKTNGTPDFKELSGQVKWFLLLFLNNFFLFLGGEKEQW